MKTAYKGLKWKGVYLKSLFILIPMKNIESEIILEKMSRSNRTVEQKRNWYEIPSATFGSQLTHGRQKTYRFHISAEIAERNISDY